MKNHVTFWLKTSFVFGLLALGFSFLGISFDEKQESTDDKSTPIERITLEHIFGHILWGMVIAIPALSLRYIIATGFFAILLDADHFIEFLDFELVSRMGHSIPFAIISGVAMMLIFGKKDYLLGIISFAAIFAHISFDVFLDTGKFPLFAPFDTTPVFFHTNEWLLILLSGMIVVASVKFLIYRKTQLKRRLASDNK